MARVWLGPKLLCDRCFDRAVSRVTGWPELPDPPGPETLRGPDGRKHHMRFRLWRSGSGIVAEAEEFTPSGKLNLDGYHFKLVGSQTSDALKPAEQLRDIVRREVGRLYLKRKWAGGDWLIDREEVRGRFVWADRDGHPYDVIVDGRKLTWEELGRALEAYEGWQFRLMIED